MNIYRVSKEAFGDLVKKLNFDILQILTEKQKISDDFDIFTSESVPLV